MSLEQVIAENTAALNKLIEVSQNLYNLRADAIETVKAAAGATKAAPKPADKKAAEEPKPNISTDPENRVDPNDNPYEGIKELIASYVGGTDRDDERAARKEKIRALLNHEKIAKPGLAADRKPSADDIRPDAIDLFKSQIAKLKEKGDITTPPAPKSTDDDLI